MMRLAAIMVAVVLTVMTVFDFVVQDVMYYPVSSVAPTVVHELGLPGIFEGDGAVTLGCALWNVPMAGSEFDDPQLFLLEGDENELLLFTVHNGRLYIISGQHCGLSIDWRRFPMEERRQDAGN